MVSINFRWQKKPKATAKKEGVLELDATTHLQAQMAAISSEISKLRADIKIPKVDECEICIGSHHRSTCQATMEEVQFVRQGNDRGGFNNYSNWRPQQNNNWTITTRPNLSAMREFYSNLRGDPRDEIIVRGQVVNISIEAIREVLHLPEEDFNYEDRAYQAMDDPPEDELPYVLCSRSAEQASRGSLGSSFGAFMIKPLEEAIQLIENICYNHFRWQKEPKATAKKAVVLELDATTHFKAQMAAISNEISKQRADINKPKVDECEICVGSHPSSTCQATMKEVQFMRQGNDRGV
ncbi:OLC1v1036105C1 [Oldenlandia corymbosa var. corymbosa]|uniref:OLC1v1036105C1 n=1 Tax=Oldenlandia corymbosa var. corymbosa TaxID=529605 RepID=A0AAV1CUM4_OLDCO|nr:OLC1v1036105C1 [Oldenlandia corymbosa var. corymbosa]